MRAERCLRSGHVGTWLIVAALLLLAPSTLPVTGVMAQDMHHLVIQTVSGGAIYVVDVDASGDNPRNLRYLTDGMDAALSPDGRQVAFTRWDNPSLGTLGSLWVIDVNGTGERLIADQLRQPKAPIWSPDGSRIALNVQTGDRLKPEYKCSSELPNGPLQADEDGDYIRVVVKVGKDGDVKVKYCYTLLPRPYWGLGTVDINDGRFTSLPHSLFSYMGDWDPQNPWRLVYRGERGLVNLDINREASWPLTDDVADRTPVFSPDGAYIAVTYRQHDHWEVHRMNADGGGRVRLTETSLRELADQRLSGKEPRSWNNAAPAWSPDGRRIAFVTDRTGRWEVWVMNADGSDQRPLLPQEMQAQLNLQYFGVDERVLSWR
ncbi:MAG: TolB family protein [Anaerolineae bacterium]